MTPLIRPSTEVAIKRITGRVVAALFGLAFVIAGFAWLYRDVAPDGHVERDTAVGVVLLVLTGGYLIDHELVTQLLAWFKDQAKGAIDVVRDWLTRPPTNPPTNPPAGGVT